MAHKSLHNLALPASPATASCISPGFPLASPQCHSLPSGPMLFPRCKNCSPVSPHRKPHITRVHLHFCLHILQKVPWGEGPPLTGLWSLVPHGQMVHISPLGTQADKQLKKIEKPSFKMIFLNPREEKMTKALCLLTWVAFWEAFGKEKKKKSCGFNWWCQKNKPIPGALFKFHSVIFFLIHFYSRCSPAAILKLRLKVILIAGVITGSCSNRAPWIQKK